MCKLFGNFVERLRHLVRSYMTDAATGGAEQPPSNELNLNCDYCRSAVVTLTCSGIYFKGIQYYSAGVSEMLLNAIRRSQGTRHYVRRPFPPIAKAKIKWDPSDASNISVWNPARRPGPDWVTVGAADTLQKLPIAQHAAARDLASTHNLPFFSEKDRLEAYERLRQHWESLAILPPAREFRQARRGLRRCLDSQSHTSDDDAHVTSNGLSASQNNGASEAGQFAQCAGRAKSTIV
ncbi:hypothetical protein [Bradyrhizobium sp. CER78]|uniref:hypothetical protein n=1 Tax=Bradyrhizobium sp. CER78 TaxID=3039162 RepID=UPI00244A7500|nr:hypothetical protein [Bradyrhizobium sp. CER78]MDH2386397.1 hypothetical protein [Bradyrhizobium sp. CER78]